MNMKQFGVLSDGTQANLYTIRGGGLVAEISDFGATLVNLWVPDREGNPADVVLGFDEAAAYAASDAFFGATVGRNANRIREGKFSLGGKTYELEKNDNGNNLHSGSDSYAYKLWDIQILAPHCIRLVLNSPDGHQGFPGNAVVSVTYTLEEPGTLRICYEGTCDQDTVFNLTNHTYFNLAGHDRPELAMDQTLQMGATVYSHAGADCLPTGELRSVAGTPMDFRTPKPIGRDIDMPYEALILQGGYDHNFEAVGAPCAILSDPVSGRTMQVLTDCPGIQFYTGNFLDGVKGKGGVVYPKRAGICLETQYYPDAVNHPEWQQPIVKAGETYRSETKYIFL